MRRSRKETIDFPANPFIAFTDFILVTVVVVTLGFLSQSVFSNKVHQRLAVQHLQDLLRDEVMGSERLQNRTPAQIELSTAQQKGQVGETWRDGDLQRFSFDGVSMYKGGLGDDSSTELTEKGKEWIIGFGQLLKFHEGDPAHPGTGLFKRLSVQGNCDENEKRKQGNDDDLWRISQARARQVADILMSQCKINPELIEATGRGSWDKSPRLKVPDSENATDPRTNKLRNRRLDIVVFYSGPLAVDYDGALKKSKER